MNPILVGARLAGERVLQIASAGKPYSYKKPARLN